MLFSAAAVSWIQVAAMSWDILAAITAAPEDFGTGYFSLYRLRMINIDKIRIDRSFEPYSPLRYR